MNSLQSALLFLPGFIIGLTFHEFAHAAAAHVLGDKWPAANGRLSLNPLRHLSPLGTLALFVIQVGWARPVESNILNFRRPKFHFFLVAMAGPLANIVLAAVLVLAIRLFPGLFEMSSQNLLLVLFYGAYINLVLALFNLLPIPPLDGSKIWPLVFSAVAPGPPLISRRTLSIIGMVGIYALVSFGLLDWLYQGISNLLVLLIQ